MQHLHIRQAACGPNNKTLQLTPQKRTKAIAEYDTDRLIRKLKDFAADPNSTDRMSDIQDLEHTLRRIDGRGYKSYRDIAGSFEFSGGRLFIDYVQGDPFAAPSKLRLRLSSEVAAIPPEVCDRKIRRIAVADFLARRVKSKIEETERRGGSGKSGLVFIDAGGQEVLERSAVVITAGWVEARIEVGLPAAGRRILGHRAGDILCRDLPELAREGLVWTDEVDTAARKWAFCVENQEAFRAELGKRELVAFIGDGAILPRRTGVSEQPLQIGQAVRFAAPNLFGWSFSCRIR